MKVPTTLEELNQLKDDLIEENMYLEYKSADALQKTELKKEKIAKTVSAMANSAGGVIIYGIKEYDDEDKRHLPERITPINRKDISKEWLEHIINSTISPKIENLKIYPITLEQPNEVAYVVEVPQSNTAHQNIKDYRYYKRLNFECIPMMDYEIRDVMNRGKYPDVIIELEVWKELDEIEYHDGSKGTEKVFKLKIFPSNIGKVLAEYVYYDIKIPSEFLFLENYEDVEFKEYFGNNMSNGIFHPILPGLKANPLEITLNSSIYRFDKEIVWNIYADNATTKNGKSKLSSIKYFDKIPKEW